LNNTFIFKKTNVKVNHILIFKLFQATFLILSVYYLEAKTKWVRKYHCDSVGSSWGLYDGIRTSIIIEPVL